MTIVLLATGGTIASRPSAEGVVAGLSGTELTGAIPELEEQGPVEVHDLININAYRIQSGQMLDIARAATAAANRPEVEGVVVTHGTDTMEESAYLTDLVHGGDEPVVFTGAQRHAGMLLSDGPANILAAVRVARSPAARGLGAVIAFEGRVDDARDATKLHTYALRAFGDPQGGPLGELTADGRFHRRGGRHRPTSLAGRHTIEARVALVKLVAGTDGMFIDVAVDRGLRGVVVECFGLGNANDAVLRSVRAAVAAGVVIVVTSRCPAGAVAPIYGHGGGHDLAQAGALFAGDLSGPKARILLMVALPAARSLGELRTLLASHTDPCS